MSIVLDGTVGIQRDDRGDIANVVWFLYGLPQDDGEPRNAVFLNESFGKNSPQMVSFDMGGEEYVIYADWDQTPERLKAHELRNFYRKYGYILISSLRENATLEAGNLRREWVTPVKCYDDYVTMISDLASVG